MKNLIITIIAIILIAVSCEIPVNQLKGRYEPITIANFTSTPGSKSHILELRENGKIYIYVGNEVMQIGRYYNNLGQEGLLWNYKDTETNFYFRTNEGDTVLKFTKRNNFLELSYKKITSTTSKPVEKKKINNWLN